MGEQSNPQHSSLVAGYDDAVVLAALERFYASGGEPQWLTADGRPDVEKMRRLGREFGYPECCIEEFVADAEADRLSGHRGLDPTGRYVPCSACMEPTS